MTLPLLYHFFQDEEIPSSPVQSRDENSDIKLDKADIQKIAKESNNSYFLKYAQIKIKNKKEEILEECYMDDSNKIEKSDK